MPNLIIMSEICTLFFQEQTYLDASYTTFKFLQVRKILIFAGGTLPTTNSWVKPVIAKYKCYMKIQQDKHQFQKGEHQFNCTQRS